MSAFTRWMDRHLYPAFGANWDDARFREVILGYLRREHRVLDFGAGRGLVVQMRFHGEAAWIAGVDVDPAVLSNPNLDEAHVIPLDTGRLPFEAGTFDLVFSDNVLEHLDQPDPVFREIARVLKPSGVFLAKTPNRWHYMPLVAQCTPSGFHRLYNRWRGRRVTDTFPTRYRANSPRRIRQLCAQAGFEVIGVECLEGRPEYLRLWAFTYWAGWAYERLVNATPWLSGFRSVMIIQARKCVPADPRAGQALASDSMR